MCSSELLQAVHTIRLLPIDSGFAAALRNDPQNIESTYGIALGETASVVQSVVEQTLSMPSASVSPWDGYLTVDSDTRAVIGACGFKGAPSPDGDVEIAYFTFPDFERRGYATTMARELIALAWRDPAVRRVLAHTLPEPNASTRVLQKVAMRFAGEVFDPEDGRVWRWELIRPV